MTHAPRSVYLAGPITGLSYQEARYTWRDEFARLLKPRAPHVECFSPMRAKEFLEQMQCIDGRAQELEHMEQAFAKPLSIVTRDFNDIKERDMMVACFLGAKRVSVGTCWEFGAAFALRKPVVMVIEPEGNPHDHVFLTHTSGFRVESLEAAAHIVGSILTPGI